MSRAAASAALERALEISRELAAVADNGDVRTTARLDAERRQLLQFARQALQPLDEKDRGMLREIAQLNDRALGLLEHRKRAMGRDMDMLAVGRRAVRAYATTRLQR
jgi:hypothetical protein